MIIPPSLQTLLPRKVRWSLAAWLLGVSALAPCRGDPAIVVPAMASSPTAGGPAAVPTGAHGSTLSADQAKSALSQYLALRDQLIEERRVALIQAASAPDLASKQKILTTLQISQRDHLAQLLQFRAQVTEFNQVQQPSARVRPPAGTP